MPSGGGEGGGEGGGQVPRPQKGSGGGSGGGGGGTAKRDWVPHPDFRRVECLPDGRYRPFLKIKEDGAQTRLELGKWDDALQASWAGVVE